MINDPSLIHSSLGDSTIHDSYKYIDISIFAALNILLIYLGWTKNRYFGRILHLLQVVKLLSYVSIESKDNPEVYSLSFMSLTPAYDAIFYYGFNWLIWFGKDISSMTNADVSIWRKMLILTPIQNLLKVSFLLILVYLRHRNIRKRFYDDQNRANG
jgi:hypothetical protein